MAIKKTKKQAPIQPTEQEIDKVLKALGEAPPPEQILEVDDIDIVEVPPEEPQPLQLTKDELNRLALTQFQTRAFEAEMQLEIIKRDLYLKQIDPEGKLAGSAAYIRGRSNEAVEAKQAYAAAVKSIEDRLKISLKEYAYDDLNGLLSKVDQ